MTRLNWEKTNRDNKARKQGTQPVDEARPGKGLRRSQKASSGSTDGVKLSFPVIKRRRSRTSFFDSVVAALVRGATLPKPKRVAPELKAEIENAGGPEKWARAQHGFANKFAKLSARRDRKKGRQPASAVSQPKSKKKRIPASQIDKASELATIEHLQNKIAYHEKELTELKIRLARLQGETD